MGDPLFLVDAFAERPFTGNPAAVCLVRRFRDASWLLSVARELGQSETAFVGPAVNGVRELRWFTPNHEVDLCGHATLAAAHVLWETKSSPRGEELTFATRAGHLTARGRGADIEITLPARPATPCDVPDDVVDALGTFPISCHRSVRDLVVELEHDAELRALRPKLDLLDPAHPLIVTARSAAPAFDFVSRYLDRIDGEDPVTGSAHATLGPFWGDRLGKRELVGFQASARGGVVRVRLDEDGRGRVVHLVGRALTTVTGELEVP